MKDDPVPEERLLKLIKGAGRKDRQAQQAPASFDQAPRNSRPGPVPGAWRPLPGFMRADRLQAALLAVFAAACLFLLASFVAPYMPSALLTEKELASPGAPRENVVPEAGRKPLEYYVEAVKDKSIFSSAAPAAAAEPVSIAEADLAKDINLLGVISGEKPEAVIEDKKIDKVFYVSRGMFIGDYQVQDIQDGKVIVSRDGKRFELHL